MYKMITCDLDETLLRKDGSVSQENIDAIARAGRQGVKFVPNTGRSFWSIQPLLETLKLANLANEYVISYNGGAVVENKDHKVIISNEMPFEEATKVFSIFQTFDDIDVHIYLMNDLYIYHPRHDDEKYLKTRGVSFKELTADNLSQFRQDKIMKIIAMHPDETVQHRMYDRVKKAFDDNINCTYSSGQYLEVNHAGVDKGTATIELGRKLGIDAREIIAIGDNGNDLPMLMKVGMPVVVNNGIEDVKKVAKLVMDQDYESGVAEAINKLIP